MFLGGGPKGYVKNPNLFTPPNVSWGLNVNLGILIKMYWDTAMRVMDAYMTETMIIIIIVTTV